jgi:hypothetical protein
MGGEGWEQVAQSQAYWGVLSHERFRSERLHEAAVAEFWATGEEHIDRIVGYMRQNVSADFSPFVSLILDVELVDFCIRSRKCPIELLVLISHPRCLNTLKQISTSEGWPTASLPARWKTRPSNHSHTILSTAPSCFSIFAHRMVTAYFDGCSHSLIAEVSGPFTSVAEVRSASGASPGPYAHVPLYSGV